MVNWCRQAGKERLITRSISDLRKATETICKDKDSEHPELAFEVSIRSLENEHWTCRLSLTKVNEILFIHKRHKNRGTYQPFTSAVCPNNTSTTTDTKSFATALVLAVSHPTNVNLRAYLFYSIFTRLYT